MRVKSRAICTLISLSFLDFASQFALATIDGTNEVDISSYESYDWDDLPEEIIEYLEEKGYNEEKWDSEDFDEIEDEHIAMYEIENMFWDDIDPQIRRQLESQGYNERNWNRVGDINEMYWDEIDPRKQDALRILGFNEDNWEEEANPDTVKRPWDQLSEVEINAAGMLGYNPSTWYVKPMMNTSSIIHGKTHLDIPELSMFNLDYFAQLDIPVPLYDGQTTKDDETVVKHMQMKDYVEELRKGTSLYLKYEDDDPFKKHIEQTAHLGDRILTHLRRALGQSPLRSNGLFPQVYDNVTLNDYNWAFWLGSKNTTTPMHYDEDMINFLWVAEGRKRLVLIPNDERTHGMYSCLNDYVGHSCWTGVDILKTKEKDGGSSRVMPPHGIEVELRTGEGIMIPKMMWHAVENLEATVAFGLRIDLPEELLQ